MLIIFSKDYNLSTNLAESGGLFNKFLLYLCLKIGIKWKKTAGRSGGERDSVSLILFRNVYVKKKVPTK